MNNVAKEMADMVFQCATAANRVRECAADRCRNHQTRSTELSGRQDATDLFRAMAMNICPECSRALLLCEDSWVEFNGKRCPHREITCSMGHKTALVMLAVEDEEEVEHETH